MSVPLFKSATEASNAPEISYGVPETSYPGRFFLKVKIPDDWWKSDKEMGTRASASPSDNADFATRSIVHELLKDFFRRFDIVHPPPKGPWSKAVAGTPGWKEYSTALKEAQLLHEKEVQEKIKQAKELGNIPVLKTNAIGDKELAFVRPAKKHKHQLIIAEDYWLSNFLGRYGTGRVLDTFSLLPGEKTTISLKTYQSSTVTAKGASSIFDSLTSESANDFKAMVESEQTRSAEEEESDEWHAEAHFEAAGFGMSGGASAGGGGKTASKRQEMSRGVTSAVNKHAQKASSQRTAQVNTSSEEVETAGSENLVKRTLENINLSRTLNYTFRQMTQEYISILHLVDMKIAYTNGTVYEEYSVTELDTFVDQYINPTSMELAKATILEEIDVVLDHKDDYRQVVLPRKFEKTVGVLQADSGPPTAKRPKLSVAPFEYHAFDKKMVDTYEVSEKYKFDVPGVIVSASKNTMKTEGIICDVALGKGMALDSYAADLQKHEVSGKAMEVALLEAKRGLLRVQQSIVEKGDTKAASTLKFLLKPSVYMVPHSQRMGLEDEAEDEAERL